MSTEFLSYLTRLAPEGETLLIVRQKPRMVDGQVQLHADGAIKAVWPSFMPDHKMKPGQAWFGNTGSFIVDRFTDGKPSASAANCEFCLVLMLDDIGTKSKTPPLAPTWKMETSAGNYQWGYAFSEQPTRGEFAAAIRAMADAGYTDPGACNPVRNFRLPGSVNFKPGRNNFEARLAEFTPANEYTLAEICAALGVVPGAPEDNGPRPLKLADDGGDDVVAWLSSHGLVYSRPNPEGWMGVHCPQADQHTDGSPEGRYMPSTRSFCCLHSHCLDLNSASFLQWVANEGGPKHSPGLRDELLQAAMAGTIGQIQPTPELAAEAAAIVEEVDRKERGRVERQGWFARYAYVQSDDAFFDLEDRMLLTRRVFDATYRHTPCSSIHLTSNGKRRRIEASTYFDENRVDMGARTVQGVTYAAGESVLCSHEGRVFANRWRDARPEIRLGYDVTPWLRHMERMLPSAVEREHIYDVLACKLQRPRVKINHAILFASAKHGIGKDLAFKPFFWAIGAANVATLKSEQLHTQWGYHLECEALHIPELRQPESIDRRALENKLKPVIAAPPDYLTVERKGQHPYTILNRLLVIAMSNNRDAIALTSEDRRWFVAWSDAAPMDQDAGAEFDAWLTREGNHAVAGWLMARDISAFNPGATPPITDAKLAMIGAGRSMSESWIIEQIEARAGEFARGVVGGPWQGLCDRLQGMAPSGARLVPAALLHALSEAGWNDLGLCHNKTRQTKKHLWAAPWWTGTKAEAREAVEAPARPLGLVK